jgi:hypothetical protein
MRSKFTRSSLAIALALLAPLALAAPQALATAKTATKTFSGFQLEKTVLTPAMKKAMKAWVTANPDFNQVSCFGYTGYNLHNRPQDFLQKLAVSRAKATCSYLVSLNKNLKVLSTSGIPSSSKNANSRRVTVTLTKKASSGGGGTINNGDGTAVVGTCDSSVNVKMRSRLLHADLYFNQMVVSSISSTCASKYMDVYLMDTAGTELAHVMNKQINGPTVTLLWSDFSTLEVLSTTVRKVAISIHD